jgi:hypothetical protein
MWFSPWPSVERKDTPIFLDGIWQVVAKLSQKDRNTEQVFLFNS